MLEHLINAIVLAMAEPVEDEITIPEPEASLAGTSPFKRLFLDAMVVEESEGLSRVFHAAQKYEHNPVMLNDKPWEGWGPYTYGTVMWDEGLLKMWYQCIGKKDGKIAGRNCYAESIDGINWTKPALGLSEYEGSKANNILGDGSCSIPSVMKVPDPETSSKEWMCYGYRKDGPGVAFSDDGLNWEWTDGENPLFSSSDVVNFFYDPYNNRYVSTWKTSNRRLRAVGVAFSDDGLDWKKVIKGAVFGADDYDPDSTQIYGMPVFPYQGQYIGLPWIQHSRIFKYGPYNPPRMYEAQEDSPCNVDVQIAWSWDLINWNRTSDRKPFIENGGPDDFDNGQIYTARAPVIVDGKLYFFYGGINRLHDFIEGTQCAMGIAMLRMDGFCSMHAGNKEGSLITRREVFRTPRVYVNAKTGPKGYVCADIVDRKNNVIPGFSRSECIQFTGDSTWRSLEWKTKKFPAEWLEPDKKLRFYLKNADLYAYLPDDIDVLVDVPSNL